MEVLSVLEVLANLRARQSLLSHDGGDTSTFQDTIVATTYASKVSKLSHHPTNTAGPSLLELRVEVEVSDSF